MRPLTAAAFLSCIASVATCQPQSLLPTGRVDVRVSGLAADATDAGAILVDNGVITPMIVSVPPGGAGADVPIGAYHLTYTPPVGYRMTAGASPEADVTVLEGQSSVIAFSVEPATGTLEVRVQGLGAAATSGGSAAVQRTGASGTPLTIPVPANGVATQILATGTYDVSYSAPTGYALAGGQAASQVAVVVDGATVTVTFAVVPGLPSPVNYYPHEPPGFVLIHERYFDGTPQDAAGWTPISAGFSLQSDAGAPRSPPGVGQALLAAGQLGGVSPVDARLDWSDSPTSLYVSLWFKLSGGWLASGNQETRLLDLDVSPAASGAKVHVIVSGQDGGPYEARLRIVAPNAPLADLNRTLTPTLATLQLTRGRWYNWELVLVMSSPGQRNGQARWWIDGMKLGEYVDVLNVPGSVAAPRWDLLKWFPWWEGRTPATTADQWQQIDHIRVSRN